MKYCKYIIAAGTLAGILIASDYFCDWLAGISGRKCYIHDVLVIVSCMTVGIWLAMSTKRQKQADSAYRKLQANIRRQDKMEAVGTLASGIAHNFNNILMGILGQTSVLLLDMEKKPNIEKLEAIKLYVQQEVI